jgi:glutamine amidotransferase
MCIIAAVPAGVPLPDKATRKRMWDKNRDGAGYMTIKSGRLEVRKGFMTFESFEEFVENLDQSQPRVLHYRIGTNGANTPENTHPWNIDANAALVHNGIIGWLSGDKNVSDSKKLSEYMVNYQWHDSRWRKILEHAIGHNKVVILDAISPPIDLVPSLDSNDDNRMVILNESLGVWDNGIWYSNYGYKEYTAPSVCDPRTVTWPTIEFDRSPVLDASDPIMRTAKYVPHYDTVMLTDTDGFLYDMELQEFIANKDDFKYTPALAKKIDSLVADWHKTAKRREDKLTF